ncbi:hypothetical protein [Jiella sp. M17.18]|uniref:hypothetical protein n=1 Tax=Jiella sp. M17.18 TaxID=3234247 RepID=UPI0034DEC962
MIDLKRAALAGAAALALLAGPAFAQSGTSTTGDEPAAGAPNATNPAATETPQQPAAADGDASDATRSGGPASSAGPAEMSGAASSSPAAAGSDQPATGSSSSSSDQGQPAAAAPTPTEPAATETPRKPAAAGGEASDATRSGGPAGSAGPQDMSDQQKLDQPRNAVGDKFELPHLTPENQIRMITDICGTQMKNMDRAACQCLAEQSMTALTPPQRDYLIAAAVAPPVAARLVKDNKVGKEDQKTIFAFLNSTSDSCVKAEQGAAGSGGAAASPAPSAPAAPGNDGAAAPDAPAK